MKVIQKTITLSEKTIEMIKKIQEEAGITSFSGTLAHCVDSTYKKDYYNKYKVAGGGAPQGESIQSERDKMKEKQRLKVEQRKVERELKEEEATNYCIDVLEGVVVENEGIKSCKYPPNKEFPDATRTRPLSHII